MDWTAIITALIAALVPTGGLTAIVTLRDKKTAAFLENAGEVIAHWKQIVDDRTVRAEELKKDLDDRDRKIDELYREKDDLREKLDHARTQKAVLNVIKCRKTQCPDREPPFGSDSNIESDMSINHNHGDNK